MAQIRVKVVALMAVWVRIEAPVAFKVGGHVEPQIVIQLLDSLLSSDKRRKKSRALVTLVVRRVETECGSHVEKATSLFVTRKPDVLSGRCQLASCFGV